MVVDEIGFELLYLLCWRCQLISLYFWYGLYITVTTYLQITLSN
jgi:hypothetical protein